MNLRYVRDDNDLHQYEVAKILGVAKSTYSLWETEINIIPLKRLIIFCNYFDVSLDFALGLSKEMKYENMKKEIDYEEHRKRLKKIRKLNRYTQTEIANILHTDNGVISRYENGKNLILTSFLIEYAKLFNISCDYIMTRIDEKIPLNKEPEKDTILN